MADLSRETSCADTSFVKGISVRRTLLKAGGISTKWSTEKFKAFAVFEVRVPSSNEILAKQMQTLFPTKIVLPKVNWRRCQPKKERELCQHQKNRPTVWAPSRRFCRMMYWRTICRLDQQCWPDFWSCPCLNTQQHFLQLKPLLVTQQPLSRVVGLIQPGLAAQSLAIPSAQNAAPQLLVSRRPRPPAAPLPPSSRLLKHLFLRAAFLLDYACFLRLPGCCRLGVVASSRERKTGEPVQPCLQLLTDTALFAGDERTSESTVLRVPRCVSSISSDVWQLEKSVRLVCGKRITKF